MTENQGEAATDLPGVGDVRAVIDEATAIAKDAAPEYTITPPGAEEDETERVSQAFLVFTNPVDGAWVAASLRGVAEIAAPNGDTALVRAHNDVTLSDILAGCSVVNADITAIKAGQRTLETLNAHAAATAQAQANQALLAKLAAEGKGGRLLGGQN